MANLTERLNFSSNENNVPENAIKIDPQIDVNFYETLCKYCADNDINLNEISASEFEAAAEVLKDHNSCGDGAWFNEYYFWII